jgi:hypothetical protein
VQKVYLLRLMQIKKVGIGSACSIKSCIGLRCTKWHLLVCKKQSNKEQFSRYSDIGHSFAAIGLRKTDAASDWLLIKRHYIGKKGLLGVQLQN